MKTTSRSRAGFQLLEVSCAIFVLTAGVFGVITLLQQGLTHIGESQEFLIAGQALINEMETLRAELSREAPAAADVGSMDTSSMWGPQPFRSETPALDRLRNATGTAAVRPRADLGHGLREITVRLQWTGSHGRTIEKHLVTLIAPNREQR